MFINVINLIIVP